MSDDKLQAVIEIVSKALDIPPDDVGPESSMDNTPSWDSMGHMAVFLEFERRFGMSLDLDKVFTTSSVRDLVALVP